MRKTAGRGEDARGFPRTGCGEPCDWELLRGIARGEQEPFGLFYARWAPPLRRFLVRASGSTESGEDLLQEAFLRVLRSAARFAPPGAVRPWLFRIAANLAYSHWRRLGRSPVSAGAGLPAEAAPTAPENSPESCRIRSAFSLDVQRALDRLPANQRMVFLLKVDQGLTYEEIGAILGCPAGTVKSRLHHAVRRLRDDLRSWETPAGACPSLEER